MLCHCGGCVVLRRDLRIVGVCGFAWPQLRIVSCPGWRACSGLGKSVSRVVVRVARTYLVGDSAAVSLAMGSVDDVPLESEILCGDTDAVLGAMHERSLRSAKCRTGRAIWGVLLLAFSFVWDRYLPTCCHHHFCADSNCPTIDSERAGDGGCSKKKKISELQKAHHQAP